MSCIVSIAACPRLTSTTVLEFDWLPFIRKSQGTAHPNQIPGQREKEYISNTLLFLKIEKGQQSALRCAVDTRNRVQNNSDLVDEYKISIENQKDNEDNHELLEEKISLALGGGSSRIGSSKQEVIKKMRSKEKFYKNYEYKQKKEVANNESKDRQLRNIELQNKENYREEVRELRYKLQTRAESIAKDFFGSYNKYLSNNSTLRFGKKGSIAVKISGNRAGNWYDFSNGNGGDLFDLIQEKQGKILRRQ